ncbi:MAG: prepilin peptidase [Pseudomonadota bacterium]
MSSLAIVLVLTFPALMVAGGLRDALSYTIPNWVSLALAAIFPLAALAVGLPLPAIGLHLGVGFAALVLGMIMFALRWIGGGDAKLFAAAALWMGWPAMLHFTLYAALAGGGLTLFLLSLRSPALRPMAMMGPGWMNRLAEPQGPVPYGVAIAIGAIAALSVSPFGGVLGL